MSPQIMIRCEDCGLPMTFPEPALLGPFCDRDVQPNESFAIGAVCPSCKNAGRYFLDFDQPRSKVLQMVAHPLDTVLVSILSCDARACKSRLPLLSQWSPATTAEERKAHILGRWTAGSLICP